MGGVEGGLKVETAEYTEGETDLSDRCDDE
jgi:hypothetical protein